MMEMHNLDLPLTNMTVTLHKTLADAQTGTNVVATAETNAVGVYNFTKLSKGNYFIKHGIGSTTKQLFKQIQQQVRLANKSLKLLQLQSTYSMLSLGLI
ncbi:hypothetical protein HBP99_04060 [Listeria booriae]|nr:hypothetical protein [Listeria booriae]